MLGNARTLLDDVVGRFFDHQRAKPHATAGMGAAADGDAVGIAGDHVHGLERYAEPFGDELGEAGLVALALRGDADHQFDDALGLDQNLGLLARHAGRDIDVVGDADAAAFSAFFRLAAAPWKTGPV